MARTISVRRDASDLTIDDSYSEYGESGGREVMDDLLREVHPTVGHLARKVVSPLGSGSKAGRSAESRTFFETISGASPSDKEYGTARRNFQRYAKGRTPDLATVEGYQARYELANGERSPILDDLIVAAGGEVPEPEDEGYGELPPGELVIEVMARVKVDTGKKQKKQASDVRDRAIVMPIPRARQMEAIRDPLAEWERQLGDSIPQFEISDVQWIEARFTPKG